MAFLAVYHLVDHEVERQLKQDGGLSHAEFEVLVKLRTAATAYCGCPTWRGR